MAGCTYSLRARAKVAKQILKLSCVHLDRGCAQEGVAFHEAHLVYIHLAVRAVGTFKLWSAWRMRTWVQDVMNAPVIHRIDCSVDALT